MNGLGDVHLALAAYLPILNTLMHPNFSLQWGVAFIPHQTAVACRVIGRKISHGWQLAMARKIGECHCQGDRKSVV